MPNPDNEPQLPKNQSPIVDDRTGLVSRDWYRFFLNLLNKANTGGGGSGATITNDTTTSTNVYPTFAAATSGALSDIYTSNAKYLYKPSTGELTSEHFIAGNGIFVNNLTIDVSYTIAAGTSGMSAGPITVASGTTVTVASGSRWVVM